MTPTTPTPEQLALLARIAELRAEGSSWPATAAQMEEDLDDLKALAETHDTLFRKLSAKADRAVLKDALREAVFTLRKFLRGVKATDARLSAECLAKVGMTFYRHRPRPAARPSRPVVKGRNGDGVIDLRDLTPEQLRSIEERLKEIPDLAIHDVVAAHAMTPEELKAETRRWYAALTPARPTWNDDARRFEDADGNPVDRDGNPIDPDPPDPDPGDDGGNPVPRDPHPPTGGGGQGCGPNDQTYSPSTGNRPLATGHDSPTLPPPPSRSDTPPGDGRVEPVGLARGGVRRARRPGPDRPAAGGPAAGVVQPAAPRAHGAGGGGRGPARGAGPLRTGRDERGQAGVAGGRGGAAGEAVRDGRAGVGDAGGDVRGQGRPVPRHGVRARVGHGRAGDRGEVLREREGPGRGPAEAAGGGVPAGGRGAGGRFRVWDGGETAAEFAGLFVPLAEADFRADVSSTALRGK